MRKAAAEAIKALAIALGPGLDSPAPAGSSSASASAAEALEKGRFDKVKPVREAVQEAYAVLLDLKASLSDHTYNFANQCDKAFVGPGIRLLPIVFSKFVRHGLDDETAQ